MGYMESIGKGSMLNMDHSGMGHDGMEHGDQPMCSMDMLFTWDWKNRCIIFQWWHVRTVGQFILSLLALIGLSMGYEYAKHFASNWEAKNASSVTGLGSTNSLVLKRYKIKQSLLYGLQVGYSFMLMLVFMSYSGWFMIAVIVGAALGKYFWSGDGATRNLTCH